MNEEWSTYGHGLLVLCWLLLATTSAPLLVAMAASRSQLAHHARQHQGGCLLEQSFLQIYQIKISNPTCVLDIKAMTKTFFKSKEAFKESRI